jgi:hypothetical protein
MVDLAKHPFPAGGTVGIALRNQQSAARAIEEGGAEMGAPTSMASALFNMAPALNAYHQNQRRLRDVRWIALGTALSENWTTSQYPGNGQMKCNTISPLKWDTIAASRPNVQ